MNIYKTKGDVSLLTHFSVICLPFLLVLFNSSEAAQPNATIKAQQNSNWVHLTRKNKKKVE